MNDLQNSTHSSLSFSSNSYLQKHEKEGGSHWTMDWIRSFFLWYVCRSLCFFNWIYRIFLVTESKKGVIWKSIWSDNTSSLCFFMWGIAWINNASYSSLGIFISTSQGWKCLSDFYCVDFCIHHTRKIDAKSRYCSCSLALRWKWRIKS